MPILSAWPIISFLVLLIYRRILIGYNYPFYPEVATDLLLLSLMFCLAIRRSSLWAKTLQSIVAVYLIIFYWADTCVMVSVNNSLTWDTFVANYKYINSIGYFISAKLIIFTSVLAIIILLSCRKSFKLPFQTDSVNLLSFEILFILVIVYLFLDHTPAQQNKHVLNIESNFHARDISSQTPLFIESKYPFIVERANHFLDGLWHSSPDPQAVKPNIVLILSEALSGVDSKYADGLFNRLPKIDQIQQEGVAFTHAVSNGKITVHGLASLLLGVQPTKTGGYETIGAQFPADILGANNLIAYAKKAGYHTVVISAGQPREWFGLSSWFKAVGFEEIYDRESPEFKDAPRFTWDAPSDEAMYNLAQTLVSQQKAPYLILVETVSLHPLYILPDPEYHISSSPLLNQIHYVDETTYHFYENLKKSGFFKDGIFILMGDHRRFEPLEKEELESGGYPDWHERIICTMTGLNLPPAIRIHTPVSLIDMNILLHSIIGGKPVNQTLFTDAHLSKLLGVDSPFSVTLADENKQTYLVRSADYPPMFLSLYGEIDFDKIPYEAYKAAAIYLIQNYQYMTSRVANQ